MSLKLVKLVYQYDMELVDDDLDYEASCHMHFMWFKPVLDNFSGKCLLRVDGYV